MPLLNRQHDTGRGFLRGRGLRLLLIAGLVIGIVLSPLVAPGSLCSGWGGLFVYTAYNVQRCLTEGVYVDAQSASGETPLMGAAMIGDVVAVRMLLEAGARAGTCDKAGLTALDWAKRFNHTAVIDLLEQQ